MSDTLYLDTARLGLMSPSAQRLQTAFARLSGDPDGLLYFEDFLRSGVACLPTKLADRFSSLVAWRGIDDLATAIRRLTSAPTDVEVLFASRSATLMKLASNRLAASCRRVLAADSLWPPYRRILVHTCRKSGLALVVANIRDAALRNDAPRVTLADLVCDAYLRHRCDGLALPLIDHRGVSLPVNQIVDRLDCLGRRPRYVIVDGSQALGHIPVDFGCLGGDMLVAGTHKWIGGYQPLGIGVSRLPAKHLLDDPPTDDPLFRFSRETAGVACGRHGETAAVLPLLTAAGALADLDDFSVNQRLQGRLANRHRLTLLLEEAGWKCVRQRVEHHGLLIARPASGQPRLGSRARRRLLAEYGVAATAYASGLVRFSLPSEPFSISHLVQLNAALMPEGQPRHVRGVASLSIKAPAPPSRAMLEP